MGDRTKPSVKAGNTITARTIILMLLCAAKGIWFIVEQPQSSLMQFHVLFQRQLKLVGIRMLNIKMADFGAETLKPTILYSSSFD